MSLPKEPEEIMGVKKLTLPFTKSNTYLNHYISLQKPPEPEPRNPQQEAYDSLTSEEKQAMSDAENIIFEVTRRAKILLEKEQRILEDADAAANDPPILSGYNKPFNPTSAEIQAKYEIVETLDERNLIVAGINAKTKMDSVHETLVKELKAEQEAKK